VSLLTTAAFAVCALAIGRGDAGWARHARPDYTFQAGWLGYSAWRGAGAAPPAASLRGLSHGTAIAAIVAAACLAASAALAAIYVGVVVCGGAGGHVAAAAAPAAIVLAAGLGVAYTLIAVFGASAGRALGVGTAVPWPDVGLCLGWGSALLWGVSACFACGLPSRKEEAWSAEAPPPPPPGPLQAAAMATPSTAAPFTADLPPETAASLGARANSAADKTAAKFAGTSTTRPRSAYGSSSRAGTAGSFGGGGEGPSAPASVFGGSTDGGSAAPPAPIPQAPPPEAVPPPSSKLGFFQRVISGKKETDGEG
jgi:hypothetical protein